MINEIHPKNIYANITIPLTSRWKRFWLLFKKATVIQADDGGIFHFKHWHGKNYVTKCTPGGSNGKGV